MVSVLALAPAKPVPTLEELERASWLPPELVAERDRLRGLADAWEHAQREMARLKEEAAEARELEDRRRRARDVRHPVEPTAADNVCIFDRRSLSGMLAEIDGVEHHYSGQTVTCFPSELVQRWRAQKPNRSLRGVSPSALESLPDAVAKTWPAREIMNFDGLTSRPACVQIAIDIVANTTSTFWLSRWLKSARNQGDHELEKAIRRRYKEPDEAA